MVSAANDKNDPTPTARDAVEMPLGARNEMLTNLARMDITDSDVRLALQKLSDDDSPAGSDERVLEALVASYRQATRDTEADLSKAAEAYKRRPTVNLADVLHNLQPDELA